MIVGPNETKAGLMARGVSEADADELLLFREMLPKIAAYKTLPEGAEKAAVRTYALGEDDAAQRSAFRAAVDASIAESRGTPQEERSDG